MATDLKFLETFQDGFTATWCPPYANPQCARNWDWNTFDPTDEAKGELDHREEMALRKNQDFLSLISIVTEFNHASNS